MIDTIISLLDYIKKNTSSSLSDNLECMFGKKTLRVMLINIFLWLKRNKKFDNDKPLKLSMRYKWHKDIVLLVSENKEIQDFFEIYDNCLYLSSNLSQETKKNIINYVFHNYSPSLRTKKFKNEIIETPIPGRKD